MHFFEEFDIFCEFAHFRFIFSNEISQDLAKLQHKPKTFARFTRLKVQIDKITKITTQFFFLRFKVTTVLIKLHLEKIDSLDAPTNDVAIEAFMRLPNHDISRDTLRSLTQVLLVLVNIFTGSLAANVLFQGLCKSIRQ